MANAQKIDHGQTTDLRRRAVMRGAAWAMPSLAVSVTAPAIAASGECTVFTHDYTDAGAFVRVPIPPEAEYVDYLVRGAGGGGTGGVGAVGSGRLSFAAGSVRELIVIVGEGGETTSDGSSAVGGRGFGRGGAPTPGPRESSASVGAGGGGSAILLAEYTPAVVAGAGGGSAVSQFVLGSTALTQTHNQPFQGLQFGRASAAAGTGNGRAAGMGRAGQTGTGMVVGPALAAKGAVGGQGGGNSTYVANGNWKSTEIKKGDNGGAQGSGAYGGGNGGDGSARQSNGNQFVTAAGGGGGGYAGGGGGGMIGATFLEDTRMTISAGTGGASSNFAMASTAELTVEHAGFENYNGSAGETRGHDGFVRLSWCA